MPTRARGLLFFGPRGNISGAVEYLLRDDFLTNEAAPLASPRTCEPGPGTLTLVDTVTGADATISGGRYLRPRPTSGQGYGNYGLVSVGGFTRTQGLSFYAESEGSVIDNYYPIAVNDSSALTQNVQAAAIWFSNTAGLRILSPFSIAIGSSLSINTIYQTMIVMRSSGFLAFIRGGSQFPDWTLLYPSSLRNQATLYALSPNNNADVKHDTVRVLQRGAPFDSDFGGCTYFDATPTTGDAGGGEADGITQFTWTPAAAQTLSIYFRRTDDDNTYRLDCDQVAGTIRLYRRDTAVDTELDAGKTQTWTAGTPIQIIIRHHAGEIRTFTEPAAGTAEKHVVSGETFNLAATGIKAAGFTAAADLACWPTVWAGDDEWNLALP